MARKNRLASINPRTGLGLELVLWVGAAASLLLSSVVPPDLISQLLALWPYCSVVLGVWLLLSKASLLPPMSPALKSASILSILAVILVAKFATLGLFTYAGGIASTARDAYAEWQQHH
jgi:hypothetical protein